MRSVVPLFNIDQVYPVFRHHKYCVIEVSGLLVISGEVAGHAGVYLLDGVEDHTSMESLLAGGGNSKRVRITDLGLIQFVSHNLQRKSGGLDIGYRAQVAGTIEVDDGEVQLSYVSQAFIHDKSTLLKYEPGE